MYQFFQITSGTCSITGSKTDQNTLHYIKTGYQYFNHTHLIEFKELFAADNIQVVVLYRESKCLFNSSLNTLKKTIYIYINLKLLYFQYLTIFSQAIIFNIVN